MDKAITKNSSKKKLWEEVEALRAELDRLYDDLEDARCKLASCRFSSNVAKAALEGRYPVA